MICRYYRYNYLIRFMYKWSRKRKKKTKTKNKIRCELKEMVFGYQTPPVLIYNKIYSIQNKWLFSFIFIFFFFSFLLWLWSVLFAIHSFMMMTAFAWDKIIKYDVVKVNEDEAYTQSIVYKHNLIHNWNEKKFVFFFMLSFSVFLFLILSIDFRRPDICSFVPFVFHFFHIIIFDSIETITTTITTFISFAL